MPAQQRFRRSDLQAARVHLGLVDQRQLISVDGLAQVAQQLGLFLQIHRHGRVEDGEVTATDLAHRVHGRAGMADDAGARTMLGVAGDADGAQQFRLTCFAAALSRWRHQPRRQAARTGQVGIDHQHEAVATDAGQDDKAISRRGQHALNELGDGTVTAGQVKGFVDRLQVVESDKQHAQLPLAPVALRGGLIEGLIEALARRHARQGGLIGWWLRRPGCQTLNGRLQALDQTPLPPEQPGAKASQCGQGKHAAPQPGDGCNGSRGGIRQAHDSVIGHALAGLSGRALPGLSGQAAANPSQRSGPDGLNRALHQIRSTAAP